MQAPVAITAQQEADDLLRQWQANRGLPPELRLIAVGDHTPEPAHYAPASDAELDATLDRISEVIG